MRKSRWGRAGWCVVLAIVLGGTFRLHAQRSLPASSVVVLEVQPPDSGAVVKRVGATEWDRAYTNQVLRPGDQVRTRENGRMTLRWFDNSNVRLPPLSDVLIEESPAAKAQPSFRLLRGLLYLFHRDKPTEARFNTRTASAAVRGTEFILEYREAEDRTVLAVLDGVVELSNSSGSNTLFSGEQGTAEPGRVPTKAVLKADTLIQWFLYYPGVLDVDELELGAAEKQALAPSLAAYRMGDLPGALAQYPADRKPASPAEKVYYGAVLLSAGQVGRTVEVLDTLATEGKPDERTTRLAEALRMLIATVTRQPVPSTSNAPPANLRAVPASARLASEWLAESYYLQSQFKLTEALHAARQAVKQAPEFGLGQARLAELEFSCGNSARALEALEKALRLSPRNAQAVALKGYVLCAQNKITDAHKCFDQAIALDGGLGNAWLGRGLCKIRRNQIQAGKDDIQVAVTMEPQRAILRSYLSKAYSEARDPKAARHEIELAREKDPNDPTSWFYSALLYQEYNRVNEAVSDLEKSQELNKNRSLYRSGLMLDQDLAVRGANLAAIYRDAGMFDVSVREAGQAVNTDYANYSAHLFLADSYNQLRDQRTVSQRFETATVDEYLVATLLAPVGAGLLSPTVSQQEYSKLFERDRFRLFSSTEYLSRGAWQENAAQYGHFGNLSYSLDVNYRTDPGQYQNNDLEFLSGGLVLKPQITPKDTVYFEVLATKSKFGDLTQLYDPATVNRTVRYEETQEPIMLAGYHHEWAPGNHTLMLFGWMQDTLKVTNNTEDTFVLMRSFNQGQLTRVVPYTVGQDYKSDLGIYTAEAQQILQKDRFTFILGGRLQTGEIDTRNTNTLPGTYIFADENGRLRRLDASLFGDTEQEADSLFQRLSCYGYAQWQVVEPLRLIAGVSYDWLKFPANFRFAPVTDDETTTDQVSPKLGLILNLPTETVLRAAYTRSLGGASIDQSFQLEPSQVAGFNQVWRSIIPESVEGANAGASFETWDVSLEQKLPTRTYLAVAGEVLKSDLDREVGVYDRLNYTNLSTANGAWYYASTMGEALDFEERTLMVTVNQLVGQEWAFGASYRLSQAELDGVYTDVPDSVPIVGGSKSRHQEATLHRVNLSALYNHRCGFFAEFDSLWIKQTNEGYTPELAGDDFWQFNAFVGYRFPRHQATLRLGLLNLTDQNYHLNSLNLMSDLPRTRTLAVSATFSF